MGSKVVESSREMWREDDQAGVGGRGEARDRYSRGGQVSRMPQIVTTKPFAHEAGVDSGHCDSGSNSNEENGRGDELYVKRILGSLTTQTRR